MGILKVVFIILLLLFPLGQIARLEFQNGVAVTLSDIAVGAVMIIFFFNKRPKQIFKKSVSKPIIIFAGVSLLSILIRIGDLNISALIVSSLYGIRWILYAGILFVVSQFNFEFKKIILKTMIFVGGLVVSLGYLQYFLYPNLRNLYYLGWDEHLYRMFSSFLDPNFAGSFFVLYFIFVFGLTLNFLKGKEKNNALFLSVISICTIFAVLLTYSRSALIMLIVGSTTLFLLMKQKKLIFMILGVSVIFFVFAANNFYSESLNLLRTDSSKARLDSASNAIAIIQDNPIIGVGFNAYRYAQVKYGFVKEDSVVLSHSGAGTDNSILFVFATTGIIGLVSYLYLWSNIFRSLFKALNYDGFQKTMAIIAISSMIGIFTNAFFINSLFYPSIMLWIWILVGINSEPKESK